MALAPKPVTLTAGSNPNPGLDPEPLVIVGTQRLISPQAAVTNISTADATDAASAVTLANATKAKVNAILAALRSAGVIVP